MRKRSIFFRSLEKKKLIFPLLVCIIIIVIINIIGGKSVNNIRSKITASVVSLSEIFHDFLSKTLTVKSFFSGDMNKMIFKLRAENRKLKYEIENIEPVKRENEELRKLLNLKNQISANIVIGKIINVFSNDYVKSCVINIGSNDGVEIDDILRNHEGFIGRICEVHEKWSRAFFITDNNSKLAVKIGKEQINAIISGNNSEVLNISMKNEDIVIKDGDIAETACFENSLCNQIPVGKVFEKHGSFFIKPFVNFNNLQYVCVLKSK